MPPPQQHDLVSVVMPVHNALPYLDEAVRSILDQSHRNLEFVIYDDASTDGSSDRLQAWAQQDERIQLHRGETNLGPARSSNAAVERASANFIARMDADDISHPDRISRQLDVLQARPDVSLVGSLCEIIDSRGRQLRGPDLWRLRRSSWFAPFPHGSVMYRRDVFDRLQGYREACEYWEDQDFFLRVSGSSKIVTIPKPLYRHRQSQVSTRLSSRRPKVEAAVDLMYRCMTQLEARGDYEGVLAAGKRIGEANRLDPRVFISIGSIELWAGGRPQMVGRLLRQGRLGINIWSAAALAWTLWAAVSPETLRASLNLVARLRNRIVHGNHPPDEPVEWTLPQTRTVMLGDHFD